MDYDKMIDDLRWWAEHCDRTNHGCQARRILSDAATAIEALRAENERLREEWDKYQPREHWETLNEVIDNLRADLARVTAERDEAVEQLHGICSACQNYSPYHNRGKCRFCVYEPTRDKDAEVNDNWKWRGIKED